LVVEQPSKSSPLNELCSALPSLPMRLQQVGRFVAANDYDATTRSMRELAASAGAHPASFTRLAKALSYSDWDELRAALTEARRPAQSAPLVIGFALYSRASVLSARAAHRFGARLVAIAQSLAAAAFVLGGTGAKKRLEETEARLAATSQYVAEKGE
jgi:hypothetical protein